ncbi:LysR family transcriptional regulator [Methylopila henanensis]|uniref:LysR family transcriptional regulator n=1 Tax=Methylopila henanensis TaxID=873516 RepID=A0ABW4K8L6_9HYPH
MLELAQARAFLVVAGELNFGRAARRLNLTQSALSRQVQALERALDARLFERTTRSVTLTPAGHAFMAEAQALLRRAEDAIQAVRRAAGRGAGALTVGFIGATCYGYLPRLVARARRELPDVALTWRELDSAEQVVELEFGRIDLGLVRPIPETRRVRSRCVTRETLALAIPADHPLAARRRPPLGLLAGAPFIAYAPEARHLHDIVEGALSEAGVEPLRIQQMKHAQAILALVSAGLGLAIVPSEARNACFDNVVFRPLELGAARAELHAVWSDDNRNPALGPFAALLDDGV